MRLALLVFVGLLFVPFTAQAACTLPPGVEGQILYNQDYKLVQFCDATNWVKLGGSTIDSRIGTLTANKWCAANAGGTGFDCTQNAPATALAGTTNYVAKFTSASAIGNSLIYDNGTNVGIGTTNPASILHVKGAWSGIHGMAEFTGTNAGLIRINDQAQISPAGEWLFGTDNDQFKIYRHNAAGEVNNWSVKLVLDSEGYLGIGTATPAAPLQIVKGGSSGLPASSGTTSSGLISRLAVGDGNAVLDFGLQGVGTASSWIQATNSTNFATNYSLLLNPNGGNVGIGTTGPGRKLEIADGNLPQLRLTNTTGSTYADLQTDNGGSLILAPSSQTVYMNGTAPTFIQFKSGATTNVLRANGDSFITGGNVGIGTASPTQKLDVNGVVASHGVAYPWRWFTRSSSGVNFATTTWTDIPGATLTFTLPVAADVDTQFDTAVYASENGLHCSMTFVIDGVVQGHPTYGDVISVGNSTSAWQTMARSRWFTLAAGSHTIKIQGRSNAAGAAISNCRIDGGDYSTMTFSVVAYPNS